jgi:hypothetical protein
MAANTRIQVRRGYSVGYSSENLIGATPLTAIWTNATQLSEGEIGYEIDTGRFKIGKYSNGTLVTWQNLPYAGGSNIIPGYSSATGVGSGISTQYSESTNSYTIHNSIVTSGNGISLYPTSITGNGLTAPTGSGWLFGLSDRLQTLSNLTSSGIIVGIDASGVTTRSLSDGDNITISNRDGISNNPIISLNSSITGLNSISGVNNFTIASNSGINFNAGDGTVSMDDLTVSGSTNLNGDINIGLAARILATGPIAFSGNPVAFVGQTLFDTLPKVGPTGNNGANATGVSLSGHTHVYTDVTDFCEGVASCVDTALLASTGIQLSYSNDTLSIALSGQSLRLHNLNDNGLITRSGDNILARTISPSGSNIFIGNGDGVGGNPNVGLNPDVSITSLSTTAAVTVGTNLIVQGNLTVNGDTVTTNVETIVVEDPTIKLGQPSGTLSTSDEKDRGIEFVYQTGNAVPITGFFGFDHSSKSFSFLNNVTNTNGIYSGTSSLLNVGELVSTGPISGTILTSTVASPTAPIAVTSTGLVSNLHADLLDGQHGSHYLNAGNLTGTLPSGRLPSLPSAFSITDSSPTSGYLFVNGLTVDSAGRLSSATSGIIPTATSANLGLAKFSTDNFSVDANGNVTIKDNGVILGTETSGQYAQSLTVSGTGLSATNAGVDDGTAYTITINATPSNVTGTIVARSDSGNFSATNVTITGLITESVSGSLPNGIYKSSSISGINNTTYLHNFIIDGGTP